MESDEIPLLELNREEHPDRRNRGEHQVADRHHGGGPEGDHESEQERVPHEAVEQRCGKTRRYVFLLREVQVDLAQPKEIEVVDEDRGCENQTPASE